MAVGQRKRSCPWVIKGGKEIKEGITAGGHILKMPNGHTVLARPIPRTCRDLFRNLKPPQNERKPGKGAIRIGW